MPELLVIHHSPSPVTHTLLEAMRRGLAADGLEDVRATFRPALGVTVPDVLDADGYLLGTTVNFGYMSGALKYAFDTFYYQCLEFTSGRPWGIWVHGNSDVDGAVASVRRIVVGLGWKEVHEPLRLIGEPSAQDLEQCADLASTVAANLLD